MSLSEICFPILLQRRHAGDEQRKALNYPIQASAQELANPTLTMEPPSAPPFPASATEICVEMSPSGCINELQREQEALRLDNLSITDWMISYHNLIEKKLIGSGAFGFVYKAKWNSAPVAIKEFKGSAIYDECSSSTGQRVSLWQSLSPDGVREIQSLGRLRHPNVVSFLGVVRDPFCVVVELMPRGSLFQAISTCGPSIKAGQPAETTGDCNSPARSLRCRSLRSWELRLRIARDTAAGMAYLHSKGILHRNLKSANVLLGVDWTAKVRFIRPWCLEIAFFFQTFRYSGSFFLSLSLSYTHTRKHTCLFGPFPLFL